MSSLFFCVSAIAPCSSPLRMRIIKFIKQAFSISCTLGTAIFSINDHGWITTGGAHNVQRPINQSIDQNAPDQTHMGNYVSGGCLWKWLYKKKQDNHYASVRTILAGCTSLPMRLVGHVTALRAWRLIASMLRRMPSVLRSGFVWMRYQWSLMTAWHA